MKELKLNLLLSQKILDQQIESKINEIIDYINEQKKEENNEKDIDTNK